MPYVEVNRTACTGCGVCVDTCPPDVLRLDPENKVFMAYPEDCQGCFVCQWDCKFEALRVRVRERDKAATQRTFCHKERN